MSPSVIRQTKVLLTLLLFLHLSISTIAAPFAPTTEHVPSLNDGLNIYPYAQDEIEKYAFKDVDKHLNSRSDGNTDPTSRNTLQKQRGLITKIHSEFAGEFPWVFENSGEHPDDWDEDYDCSWNEKDVFQESYSGGVEGWGSMRSVLDSSAPRLAKVGQHPPPVFYQEERFHQGHLAKRDIGHSDSRPQEVPSFPRRFHPSCPSGLNPTHELSDIPKTPNELEHSETSWLTMDNLAVPHFPFGNQPREDIQSWEERIRRNHADKELSPSEFEARAPPLDTEISIIFEIGNALNAAVATEAGQDATEFWGPDSPLAVDVPYTETLMEYHEIQTVCITREVGPILICERVYGDTDGHNLVGGDELSIEPLRVNLESQQESRGKETVNYDSIPREGHPRAFVQGQQHGHPELDAEVRNSKPVEEPKRLRYDEEPRYHRPEEPRHPRYEEDTRRSRIGEDHKHHRPEEPRHPRYEEDTRRPRFDDDPRRPRFGEESRRHP